MSMKRLKELIIEGKEFFWGSGTEHPDVTAATAKRSDEDHGSRPLALGLLRGKGPGPAVGVQGNALRRLTRYLGGRLIEFYTDYWVSTKYGSLLTDGRKVRVKHLLAAANTFESYLVRPHDHILKINQSALGAQAFVVLLPSLFNVGFGATPLVPNQNQSHTIRGAWADNQVDRQFWGRELFIESYEAKAAGDIIIRTSVDLVLAGLTWFQSGTPNEWYVTLDSGLTANLVNDTVFYINGNLSATAIVGNLAPGQHGFGDNDGLGFNTFYVFSVTNPNLSNINAGYAQIARITVLNEKFHLVSVWNETWWRPEWNVLQQSVVTTSTTTTTSTSTTTSTTTTAP